MKFKEYSYPLDVGWRGWIESCVGETIAFVSLDGSIVWEW